MTPIPPNGSPVTVFVAVPADDGHKLKFWQCLMDLMMAPKVDGVTYRIMPVPGDSLIPRVRNNLAYLWFKHSPDDYLLFLDTDLDFRVQDVQALVRHRLPIVCGLYGKKQAELGWVINTLRNGPSFTIDGGIHRVACAGTGAFLMHRSVMEKMIEEADAWPHWKIKYKDDNDGSERWHLFSHVVIDDPIEFARSPRDMSEDWSFCYYARKIGFDVWLDTSAVFLHEGSALYPLQARRMTREEVQAGEITQPDGSKTPVPLGEKEVAV